MTVEMAPLQARQCLHPACGPSYSFLPRLSQRLTPHSKLLPCSIGYSSRPVWAGGQVQDHIAEGPAYFMGGFAVIKQSTLQGPLVVENGNPQSNLNCSPLQGPKLSTACGPPQFEVFCCTGICSIYFEVHILCECLVAQSCPTVRDPLACSPPGSFCPWGFSRQEYWSGLF